MIGVKATVLPWMRIFIVRFLCNCVYMVRETGFVWLIPGV